MIDRLPVNSTYLGAAIVLGVVVVSVWPLGYAPVFYHDDAAIHLLSGAAIALAVAAVVPERDDMILAFVALVGLAWEPVEAVILWPSTVDEFVYWMASEDTLADIAMVIIGGFGALLAIRRYR